MASLRSPFPRELPREVHVLTTVAFFVALGFGIVAPSIVLFAKELGGTNFQAGLVIAVFAAARFVSAPLWGRLIGRVSERSLMSVGFAIVGLSSLLSGFAQDLDQLIVLRGAGGFGSAMFTVAAFSLLLRVAPPDMRGQSSAAFQGGFLLGGITGPFLGAPLVLWSLRAPFFFYAGTLVLAGVVAMMFLHESRLPARPPLSAAERDALAARKPMSFARAWRHRAYRTALVNAFVNGWGQSGTRTLLLPPFVTVVLGAGEIWVAIGIGVGAVTQFLALGWSGRASDTKGRKPTLLIGEALTLAAVLVLAVLQFLPVYLAVMAVFGIGAAFVGASSAAVVADVTGGRAGTSASAYQQFGDAANIGAPLLLGWLSTDFSYETAFLASAAVTLVGLVLIATMPETRPRTPGTDDDGLEDAAGEQLPPGVDPIES